jgi:hypothetical protein
MEHIDNSFLFMPLPKSDPRHGGDGPATVLAASTNTLCGSREGIEFAVKP